MCSSVVERCPDKTEAVGPIPTTRTQDGIHSHMQLAAVYKTEAEGPIPS